MEFSFVGAPMVAMEGLTPNGRLRGIESEIGQSEYSDTLLSPDRTPSLLPLKNQILRVQRAPRLGTKRQRPYPTTLARDRLETIFLSVLLNARLKIAKLLTKNENKIRKSIQ
jgi:hypothetical protein